MLASYPRSRSGVKIGLAVGIINILIFIVIFGQVIVHPATMFRAETDDAQQTMWFMGWFWHAIIHGQNPFVTHLINYPRSVNMMINASIIPEAALFGPLIFLVNSAFAYNVMIFVNLCVVGLFGTLIFRELGVRTWLSLFGGILMEILPYTSAQLLGHANLFVTMWLFVTIYLVIRTVKRGTARPIVGGSLIGLVLAAQFYTSIEVFATLTIVSIIGVVIGFVLMPRDLLAGVKRIPLRYYMSCAVVCILLAAPGLYFFKYGPSTPTGNIVPSTLFSDTYVNDLASFLIPSPVYLLSPIYLFHSNTIRAVMLGFTGNFSEQDGYIGLVGIVLLVWAAKRMWKRPLARVVILLTLIVAVMSMGVHLHILGHITNIPLLWAAIAHLPIINQALPSRLMLFSDILIVILIFTAFEDFLQCTHERRNFRNVTVVSLLLMITWLPTYQYPRTQTPTAFSSIEPGGAIYGDLQGQPTLVFSNDFMQVMQALVDGKYSFPVANVYAYQNDSASERTYRPFYLDWVRNYQGQELDRYLASMIAATHVRRVLFQPTEPTTIPPSLLQALDRICGQPKEDAAHGTYVWDVPASLSAVWVTGDVWDPGALFRTKIGKLSIQQWVGANWGVYTQNQSCVVTIIAPPANLLPGGCNLSITGSMERNIHLAPGQKLSLEIKPNQSIVFHSNTTFVPNSIEHNGDTRVLSCGLQLAFSR